MIKAPKSVRTINSFQYVAVPSPRDVFIRYGERQSAKGEYTTDGTTQVNPSIVNRSSVIDEMINAEMMLRASVEQDKPSGSKH